MSANKSLILHSNSYIAFNCEEKMNSGSFKNIINKMCRQNLHIYYIYKKKTRPIGVMFRVFANGLGDRE